MEFWNSLLTEKSWKILQELNKKYHFILIGGWAVYLWTQQQKSKDIDILVDIKELQKLKQENLGKNDRLKKYEIKIDEIEIDIYVAHFSQLVLPVEDLDKYCTQIESFTVVLPEVLLILKQGAEVDRGNSPKDEKDKIDILSLLLFSEIDFKKYWSILREYKMENYLDRLISLVREFSDYERFSMTPRAFKLKKKMLINCLKKV